MLIGIALSIPSYLFRDDIIAGLLAWGGLILILIGIAGIIKLALFSSNDSEEAEQINLLNNDLTDIFESRTSIDYKMKTAYSRIDAEDLTDSRKQFIWDNFKEALHKERSH